MFFQLAIFSIFLRSKPKINESNIAQTQIFTDAEKLENAEQSLKNPLSTCFLTLKNCETIQIHQDSTRISGQNLEWFDAR